MLLDSNDCYEILQSSSSLNMSAAKRVQTAIEVREIIRNRLNLEKIKLWLEPYTASDGQRGPAIDQLVENYSLSLNLAKEVVEETVDNLRQHAVNKWSAMQRFNEKGIATLKVRLTGNVPNNMDSIWIESGHSVDLSLESKGLDLKHRIAELSGISSSVLKPVANGKVVEDDVSLLHQQIKNFNEVLVLCLSADEANIIESDSHSARVAKTRKAAEIMTGYNDNDDGDDSRYQLQIADQRGKVIEIPKEEKKALVLAMMLHEKGRAALKRKETSLALVYLLEADEEFKKCCSDILDYVDNYALLCLDIVWSYLRLQNISSLPDAELRLRKCEDSFKKSYGQNLERLRVVKGGTGKEQALLVRLHLLQAVLAFHQSKNQICLQKLQQVESELARLQVDKECMTQVMAMGFSAAEARLGLRVSGNNVTRALAHIIEQREEKEKRLKAERAERKNKRLEVKLGKTASGEQVSASAYRMLISMGFPKGASAEALRQTNNDIQNAIQVIQEQPELLSLADPDPDPESQVSDEMIRQVMALGFDEDSVRAALHHFTADVDRSIEELMRHGGLALPEWYQSIPQSPQTSSTNSSTASQASSNDDLEQERKANQERMKLIEEEIIPDIPQNEEDHLDLELEDEAAVFEEYKALLASVE